MSDASDNAIGHATAPIEPKFREQMNVIANLLDDSLNGDTRPRTVGFLLLMFDFGNPDGGRMNYISNAQRADMLCAMKEFIAHAEGRAIDTIGNA